MTPLPSQALLDKILNLPSSPLSLYEDKPVEATVLFNLSGEVICGWSRKAGVTSIRALSDMDPVPTQTAALLIQKALKMIERSKDVSGELPNMIRVTSPSQRMIIVVDENIVTLLIVGVK